jgi:hypothetical protein
MEVVDAGAPAGLAECGPEHEELVEVMAAAGESLGSR